ncbi:MAG: GNAT family N-acetyltransferase [Gammaproteobacteria bacterium]|nr:GNAT family N-acetyltransferase [Gammaproteobacteria bacterium]
MALTGDWALQTPRLRLRRLTLDDADLMLAVWTDPAFMRNVADRGVRTLDESKEAMKTGALKLYEDYGYGPYAMVTRADGEKIGICGLFKRDNLDHPDIGYAVLPEFCGKGYAGEAASAVLAHARDDLELEELTAIVSPDNVPSIGLLEKLGLVFVSMITMPGDDEAICLYSKRLGQL